MIDSASQGTGTRPLDKTPITPYNKGVNKTRLFIMTVISSQTILKDIILEILSTGPKTIAEMNKIVFYRYHNELEAVGIEWTYQHLIASARKTLVDAGLITRDRGVYNMASEL